MEIGCLKADGTFMTADEETAWLAEKTGASKVAATILALGAAALFIE